MSKTYDQMEWNVILLALKIFGFSPRWNHWIKECLSSISYSILLNDSLFGYISPFHGLRQGNPLSPFLFVIGMEILSRMQDKAQDLFMLNEVQLSSRGPKITHMLYADDIQKKAFKHIQSRIDGKLIVEG